MAQQQPARRKTHPVETPVSIPDKLYFRIGDVARLCSLPAYVLRFWETEFPQLKPNKGGTGHRLYRKRDVEMVLEIKHLLYSEGFTIAGARRLLAEKRRGTGASDAVQLESANGSRVRNPPIPGRGAVDPDVRKNNKAASSVSPKATSDVPRLKEIRREMQELLTILASDGSDRSNAGSPRGATQPKGAPSAKRGHRANDEPTLFS